MDAVERMEGGEGEAGSGRREEGCCDRAAEE